MFSLIISLFLYFSRVSLKIVIFTHFSPYATMQHLNRKEG